MGGGRYWEIFLGFLVFSSILSLGTEEASGIIELLQITFFLVVALGVLGFYFFF